MLRRLIETLFAVPTGWAFAVVVLVAGLETALFVGFVLPGESAVFLGGVVASRGRVPLVWMLLAGTLGPLLGDVTGYLVGRRYEERFLRRKLGKRWARAHRWLSKNSGWAIFSGRFVPFVRTVLPSTAGATRVPPARFFAADLSAAIVWGVGTTLAGYLFGSQYEKVLRWLARAGWVAAVAIAVGLGTFWVVRARRRRRSKR